MREQPISSIKVKAFENVHGGDWEGAINNFIKSHKVYDIVIKICEDTGSQGFSRLYCAAITYEPTLEEQAEEKGLI